LILKNTYSTAGDFMRITESRLRQIIRRELVEARDSGNKRFLRFGNPKSVARGVSVIHDPEVIEYSEEPALRTFEPGVAPPSQKFEKGISAYSVVLETPDKVVFRAPIGVREFSRQLGGFLSDRLMRDDVWIFSGRRVRGAVGTDGEPLIDASSVRSVKPIGLKNLWVTDLDTGDVTADSASASRVLDIVDPWEIWSQHDMGYNEFFHREDVTLDELKSYILKLREKFTVPAQARKIDEIESMWLEQWHDDNPHA
jgi:hypothetical protein